MTADSFGEAYAKGFGLTVRFLLSKGANVDTAEELAQTAWVRGWEARGQLLAQERILPWINSIAYRRFCNDRRRAVRHSELIEVTDTKAAAPSTALDAGIMLSLCSPFDKKLLTQRYLEGLEMKEIAIAQGLSEIAVRVRIHRCQCALRSSVLSPCQPGVRGHNVKSRPRNAPRTRVVSGQQLAAYAA